MARSVAQITLMGYVGYKNDLKYVGENSLAILEVSVAHSRKEKLVQTTDWYKVTIFGNVATNVDKFINKGDLVLVIGQPVFSEYNGKTTINIRATSVEVISLKKNSQENTEANTEDVPF